MQISLQGAWAGPERASLLSPRRTMCKCGLYGATENAGPENAGLENDGLEFDGPEQRAVMLLVQEHMHHTKDRSDFLM